MDTQGWRISKRDTCIPELGGSIWVGPGRGVSQAGGERGIIAGLGCGGRRELPGAAAVGSRGRAGRWSH